MFQVEGAASAKALSCVLWEQGDRCGCREGGAESERRWWARQCRARIHVIQHLASGDSGLVQGGTKWVEPSQPQLTVAVF